VKHTGVPASVVAFALAAGAGCTFSWHGPQARDTATVAVESSVPTSSPTAIAASEGDLSSTPAFDLERQLRQMEEQAELLRGLTLSKRIPLEVVPKEALQAQAIADCTAQSVSEALTPETLTMLGLLGPDDDLTSDEASLAADWAANLTSRYDEPRLQIEVIDPSTLDPGWRLDYVAVYLSALRAQNVGDGASRRCCPMACATAGDAGLASAALSVGDTRLAMEQWVRVYGGAEDVAQFGSLLAPAEEASLFHAPRFLRETYAFLLTGGRAFVQDLYLSGGWPAVDQAYADPPASTEQILHPERYLKDSPFPLQAPDLGAALGRGWQLRQTVVLGEWRMRQTLQVYLPAEEAIEAAGDWGGDVLMIYRNTALDQDLLVLITRWDNLRQAQDFSLAFRKYGEARFGERRPTAHADTWTWDGGFSSLERASDQSLWIIAPDQATADSARTALEFPVPSR
jgi:hypothetical protein